MALTLFIGNSNVIELQSLTNIVTDTVDTGATVTVTLKDRAGTDVSGETWPVSMAHAAAGTYRATLDSAIDIDPSKTYSAHIDATGSGGEIGHWEVPVTATTRTTT